MLTQKSSVLSLFETSASLNPKKVALISEGNKISFSELEARSNQIANYLKLRQISTNIPICFCLNQSIDKVIVMLSIWKSGGAYVSLDPLYPETRLTHILEETNSPVLFTTKEFSEKFKFYKVEIIFIDQQRSEFEKIEPAKIDRSTEKGIAYLAYTSGSTGQPKAVMAEHIGLENFIRSFGDFLKVGEEDVALNISSSNFDGIVLDLWVPLSLGITVCLYPDNRIIGEPLLEFICKNKITILPYLPVSILATLPQDRPIGNLKKICTGGEAPIANVIAYWKQQVELINIYGPTETTVVVCGFKFDDEHPINTIGKPLPNVDFYILNERMETVQPNEIGELYIGGIQVSRGYYNQPKLTSERFLHYITPNGEAVRVYKTGDLVRGSADGTIEFIGRADQQVKIRGFRVEPTEIEENIRQSGLSENSVVIVREELGEKQLICYYKNFPNKNTLAHDLRNYLFERLPSYMIPSKFLEVDAFPLTANGKIDKSLLKELKPTEEKRNSFVAPISEFQRQIASVWSEILKTKSVGIHDNFFQFGGNSIFAYRLTTKVRQKYGLHLDAADLFLHPTIYGLEEYMGKKKNNKNEAVLYSGTFDRLSIQQQSLHFLDKLRGSVAYHVGAVYTLDEKISFGVLEKAFRQLIRKHSILRTVINEKDSTNLLSLMTEKNWLLEKLHHPDDVKKIVRIPFDLERDYMIRASVIYKDNRPVSLFLMIHHIVTDGWSMPLIVEELNDLYQKIIDDQDFEAITNYEYRNYVHWQSRQNFAEGIEFWKNYLDGVPILQLAHDFRGRSVDTDEGKQYHFELGENLIHKLQNLAQDNNTTLYTTLLSAFGLLMQYYSGQSDICIGSPTANRFYPFDRAIGYFANMLPIRMKIENNPKFSELLKLNGTIISEIFKHQSVPLETIVNHVIKDRFAGHNPLFQHVFVLQTPPEETENIAPVNPKGFQWVFNGKSKFDLQFEAIPTEKGIAVNIDYNNALFKEKTIGEMATAFIFILESIAIDPNQKIGEIKLGSLLSDLEIRSAQLTEKPQKLIALFEEQVKKTPAKNALIISGQAISYHDLDQKSSHVANQLIAFGVRPNDFVACFQEQSIERIISLLAIIKAGGAYVPLDISYPLERLGLILADVKPKAIIASENHSKNITELQYDIFSIEQLLATPFELINRSYCDTHNDEDLVYVIHTSGTTGTPKGVMIAHQSLGNFITEYGNLLALGKEDSTLQFSAYNFDGSMIDLWIPLTKGATIYLYPNNKLLGTHLAEFISLHSITALPFISPSVLSTIPQDFKLPLLKTIGTGAETCPPNVSQYWKKQVKLFNMYGPTEATVAVNQFTFDDIHPQNTIGRPINNMHFYVLDQYLRPVPPNVVGELYISGIQLSRGYLNNPELTAEKFIQNSIVEEKSSLYMRMYKTGDLVKSLEDGMIEFVGRSDHQVKIRGYRIELSEIEKLICQTKGVINAVVHVHQSSEDVKLLRAFVTGQAQASDLRNELSKKLPAYMIPNEIYHIENLPLKTNGKIDWQVLSSIAEDRIKETKDLDEDSLNQYEKTIKKIWNEVLESKITSLEDDFFHLGGHSLLLTKLYNKLYAEYPNKLTLGELYLNSTIRKLADLIEERDANPYIHEYGLGEDPLSGEIKKDATVPSDFFMFNTVEKGDFENPDAILLTGVTGFVGVNILIELLKSTTADIYLLIRAEDKKQAKIRLLKTMTDQHISLDSYNQARINYLCGDLAKPFLGLDAGGYDHLTKIIDVVYHAGSSVNFIQPYSYMRAANVDALHKLIRFVTTYKLKQLSLLSTVGAFSWEHYFTKPALLKEDTDIKSAFKYLSRDMGYIQSKWVMEQVAQEAIKQGVPIIIFRLGYVFCHSKTGATASYQWWSLLIKTCIQLKTYPTLVNQKEELIMVDFVSKAIAHISKNPASIGQVFHLSPEPKDNMTVTEFFEMLRQEFKFDLQPVPYQDWLALWEADENSPLYPLLNLFKFKAYDNKSLIEIHQNTPDFDISNTKRFIKNSDIEIPKINRNSVEAFCKYLGVL